MSSCFIRGCHNTKTITPGLSWFHVPPQPALADKWLQASGRTDVADIHARNYRVCSDHFTDKDISKMYPRVWLKKDAVPNVKLPKISSTENKASTLTSSSSTVNMKRTKKKIRSKTAKKKPGADTELATQLIATYTMRSFCGVCLTTKREARLFKNARKPYFATASRWLCASCDAKFASIESLEEKAEEAQNILVGFELGASHVKHNISRYKKRIEKLKQSPYVTSDIYNFDVSHAQMPERHANVFSVVRPSDAPTPLKDECALKLLHEKYDVKIEPKNDEDTEDHLNPDWCNEDVTENVASWSDEPLGSSDETNPLVLDSDIVEVAKNSSPWKKNKRKSDIALYKCGKCKKRFKSSKAYGKHMHSYLHSCTPKHCKICDKYFGTIKALEEHIIQFHEIEKSQHECDDCKKKFNTKSQVSEHIYSVHLNLQSYSCLLCSSICTSLGGLWRHVVRTHEEGGVKFV